MLATLTHDQVLASLVTALVTVLVTAPITVLGARWQFAAALRKIDVDVLALKEAQLRDVISKRMEAYPALWSVIQRNTSDRRIEGKAPDSTWAQDFLKELNTCHAKYGIFFSQVIYENFFRFRSALIEIEKKPANQISWTDVEELDLLWSGTEGAVGLATHLKDEMASYEIAVIRKRFSKG